MNIIDINGNHWEPFKDMIPNETHSKETYKPSNCSQTDCRFRRLSWGKGARVRPTSQRNQKPGSWKAETRQIKKFFLPCPSLDRALIHKGKADV